MEEDLFDVFDGAAAAAAGATQGKSAKKAKRKASVTPSEEGGSKEKKQKLPIEENAAAATATAAAASMQIDEPAPAQSSAPATQVGDHTLSDDDASFYRYTEQHVSVKTKTEREDARSCLSEVCYPPGWDLTHDPWKDWKPPAKPAKEYPFVLDPFQRHSVDCLEKNQSVLVSAHTSAGKTVVAEYAIAMALRDGQRVIYTSPIKALSNQKYRELYEEFNDVGLMTGDVTINPSASCLVMTTEILRNMLYLGSDTVRSCKFVIFDEVHYMRNKERGVVWEETIIMLPDKVRYVFLSATIPNGTEFALWVAKLHKQPCTVVYTDFRPTPLQHYLFPAGGEGLYLVVDEKGTFREENFQKALAVLKADEQVPGAVAAAGAGAEESTDKKGGSASNKKKNKGGKPTGPSDIYKIVRMIMERHYEPVIIFSFSKRECEQHALTMSKLDFSNDDEKKLIEQIFSNAMEALSDDDRHLPQVENILPLLRRGIGIHHGGLLPILKEVIEILFQEGLIKALFSTETFSMGLNMPCKTVVFTSVKKWDGDKFRIVTGGEYIQMSGRAGRRGLDDRGIVICMMDEQLEPNQAKEMIKGQADSLDSSFHLGYNMILNLLRVEDQNPIKMMSRSFLQFQNTRKAPAIQKQLEEKEAERAAMVLKDARGIAEYAHLLDQLQHTESDMSTFIRQPQFIEPFLNPGRLVHLGSTNLIPTANGSIAQIDTALQQKWGWGVLLSYQKRTLSSKEARAAPKVLGQAPDDQRTNGNDKTIYILDVLLHCAAGSVIPSAAASSKKNQRNAPKLSQNLKPTFSPSSSQYEPGAEYLIVPVSLTLLDRISSVRLHVPKDVRSKEARAGLGKILEDVKTQFMGTTTVTVEEKKSNSKSSKDEGKKKKGKKENEKDAAAAASSSSSSSSSPVARTLPLLDPVDDMKIADESFLKLRSKCETLKQRIKEHKYTLEGNTTEVKEQLDLYHQRVACDTQILTLKDALRNATQDVTMGTQLKHMQVVLRRLEHTTSTNVIDLKGRIGCEISTCDELLGTELMFLGVFNDLTPEQTVALCSCLVFTEKNDDDIRMKEELNGPLRVLQEAARRIATVMNDAQITIDIEEYVARFQPQLMEVVYAWCKGAKFSEVCKLTDVFEGTIIRCLRRLEELLRQFAGAAKSVGNELLETKFNLGINMLKRDIVFAASLYL